MFMKKLQEQLKAIFEMRLYDGEEGAAGGDGGGDSGGAGDSGAGEAGGDSGGGDPGPIENTTGMPDDFLANVLKNDPEYKEIYEKKAALTKEAENNPPENNDNDDDGDDKSGEQSSRGNPVETDATFADNIIPGLTGKAFALLPEQEQEAVAKYYEEAESARQELNSAKTEKAKFLEDPIIKERIQMLSSGDKNAQFSVRNMTDAEALSLADRHGFTAEEIKAMKPDLEAIARDMAENVSRNTILKSSAAREASELTSKGKEMLLGLGKFNKELNNGLTMEDYNEILASRHKGQPHPKDKAWDEGIGKIYEWAKSKEFTYNDLVKRFSEKSLYAAAAADLGLPVALNTKGRDDKIRREAVSSRLKAFMKSERNSARTLSTDSDGGMSRDAKAQILTHNGFDAIKLASDPAYLDKQMSRVGADPVKRAKVLEAASHGRKELMKKGKR